MASPDAAHLIRVYNAATARARAQAATFVERTWNSLESWRDDDVTRWGRQVVPVVQGTQRAIASTTDAYLAHLASTMQGRTVRPVGIPPDLLDNLRGVDPYDVYRRPGVAVWTALSTGVALDAAVGLGLDRALSLVATDLQLAKTHAARHVLSREHVVGYRRVLNSGNPCDLCDVASEQVYHRDDLMPIHPGCDCGVEPIYVAGDPGDLDANASTDLPDVVVHEHGELGPVLAVAGQDFTGPDDL